MGTQFESDYELDNGPDLSESALCPRDESWRIDPSWKTSDVCALWRGMELDRDFSRLPIVADALEEAGCDLDVMLRFFRHSSLFVSSDLDSVTFEIPPGIDGPTVMRGLRTLAISLDRRTPLLTEWCEARFESSWREPRPGTCFSVALDFEGTVNRSGEEQEQYLAARTPKLVLASEVAGVLAHALTYCFTGEDLFRGTRMLVRPERTAYPDTEYSVLQPTSTGLFGYGLGVANAQPDLACLAAPG